MKRARSAAAALVLSTTQRWPVKGDAAKREPTSRIKLPFHFGEKLHEPGHNLAGRFLLHPIYCKPSLVPAQGALLGGRQVSVAAIGELDGEGVFEGTLGFDLQACFCERLERNGGDAKFADPENLEGNVDRL